MDENADGGVVTSVATENATSVTVTGGDDKFEVADGNLKLKAGVTLDFETDTSPIELTITASGDGESATHTIRVSINDVNEAPTISVADGTTPDGMEAVATVAENVTGALLGEITLADEDAGQTHTLSTSDPKFVTKQDDAGGWWLALADDASLSFEDGAEVTVTVTVTDDGDPAASTSVDVIITVTDVNEAPTIEIADGETPDGMPASSTVDENNAGAILGAITLSDPDAEQTHTLEVTGDDRVVAKQDDAGGWWLALADGESFDFEADGDSIDVTVTVTDSGDPAMSASADVTITVSDINEAPEVDGEVAVPNAVFVAGAENSVDVDLGALFSDPDGDTLTYSLSDNAPDWLELTVTSSGSTITGTISGTPPAGDDMTVDGVSIIATDDGGLENEAMFDVVVDAENDAPTSLRLGVQEDDLLVSTTEVDVEENAPGAELGTVIVRDPDDDRHPHGQHEYSFMVGDDADDRFEVTDDGTLKLKDDVSLDYEAGSKIVLTIMAKDMYVTEPGEDDEDTRETISRDITITVTDVAAGDGPKVIKGGIGDWWVTVDDRLDAEDAREGEWLSFGLDTSGDDAAFTDEGTMTYSVAVEDSRGNSVNWLQIDAETGAMTNKEGMVPRAGVYTVTVTATDNDDNSTPASFRLAVAVADPDDSDNDRPDIREDEDYTYEEDSDLTNSVKVASFEVRDDDIAIAPHPYGTLDVEFTATQGGADVTNRFKLVELGDDGDDTASYEIHHKSADELFVMEKDEDGNYVFKMVEDEDGNEKKVPIEPIDYEDGDEVVFTVTAKDSLTETDEVDELTINVDIEDAADAAPRFSAPDSAEGRKVDPKTKVGTTTFKVDQQEAIKEVIVLPLSDVWSDPDTDVDELDFTVGGRDTLPDWVKVYGPDEWEDIYARREDVGRGDAPTGTSGRELAIAIVIDRTAATGDNESKGMDLAGFTLTAEDPDGNDTTENISISVMDTNVDITVDAKNPVLSIDGDANGTGSLTMDFDADQDPDLSVDDEGNVVGATLVLYTWTHDNATPDDATDDVTMVSTSPQPFVLDANRDMANDHIGRKVTATVKYYEVDPANGKIVASDEYTAATKTIRAPEPGEGSGVAASFDITTTTTGLTVDVVLANGDTTNTAITVRLESSNDGSAGTWQRAGADVTGVLAFTGTTGTATVPLPVDEDDDGNNGDGGGLYYRVVLTYGTGADQTTHTSSDMIQLGDVTTDPSGAGTPTDIIGVDPSASPVDQATVGETIRVNTDGDPANVQWQVSNIRGGYDDIEGATSHSLTVTSAYAGKNLRAKVTYTDEDDATTPTVDETGWVTWVEYTEVGAVPGGTNSAPGATQVLSKVKEIDVELPAMKKVGTGDDAMEVQPGKVQVGTASDLFHDTDDDALTYSIAIPSGSAPDPTATGFTAVVLDTSAAGNSGSREAVLGGNLVYVTYETESVADPDNAGSFISQDVGEPQQTVAIDKNTGEITYFTNMSHGHDGNDADGQGNILTFTVSATDNVTGNATAEASVAVRINVAPTAIRLQSVDSAGNDLDNDIADATVTYVDLPAPSTDPAMPEMGAALLAADDTNTPADTDGNPDTLTYTDDARNSAVKLANLNVQDENATDHDFGTHTFTLSGRGKDMFEIKETRGTADTDGSTWELYLKEGATFDFEALQTAKEKAANATEITLSITVTATDKAGLSTKGVFSVKVMDADTEDDPETPTRPDPKPAEDPETPGLKDDSDDSDQDGAVPPEDEGPEMPGDGGMFIDDLIDLHVQDNMLDAFVLAIDDIDIA